MTNGGKDPGAVSYLVEKDVNLNMALACRDYLEARGVEVKMSRIKDENDDLNEEIKECNAYDPDLAIDIHNNAGKGKGFEVFHTIGGGTGKTLAKNIETEVKAIGQTSRGCKTRKSTKGNWDYFGFIRETKCPAVIVEGAFVDNKEDAEKIDSLEEQKAFGVAYAKGILKTLGVEDSVTVVEPAPEVSKFPYLVRITASALNVRNGAGLNYKVNTVVRKNEVFTIVDEKGDWGKLKSGAGWINLGFTERV